MRNVSSSKVKNRAAPLLFTLYLASPGEHFTDIRKVCLNAADESDLVSKSATAQASALTTS